MSNLSASTSITEARYSGHVWRAKDNRINATVDFTSQGGDSSFWFCFDDPALARAVATACTEAAEAMERFAAETPASAETP